MSEAEAILELARAVDGLSFTIAIFGFLFLVFKDMGVRIDDE